MAQESLAHGCTPSICWRVTSTNELNTVQRDPGLVRGSPESVLLNELSQEGYGALCAISVGCRKVYFITENNQPAANLIWRHDNTVQRLLVLTILLESLDQKIGGCSAGKVKTHDFHVRKLPKCSKQSHGFTGTRRTTKQQWFVLCKP